MKEIKSIYIHIPFCKEKCVYCDFYSEKINENFRFIDEYLYALKLELLHYKEYLSPLVDTIYIGGGTPSLLSTTQIRYLLEFIKAQIEFERSYEFTFEMNPESVDINKLKLIYDFGVNRVSLGIQSLNNTVLKRLNRIHNKTTAIKSIDKIIGSNFTNVGVDFLLGVVKGSTTIIKDIEAILSQFDIKHISTYIITLNKERKREIHPSIANIGEDEVVREYVDIHRFLSERGFLHYEISNYAKKQFESRHNINYWENGYYIGLGASAAGHYINYRGKIIRYKNVSNIQEYIKSIRSGKPSFEEYEEIDSLTDANEYIMLSLRTAHGLSIKKIKNLIGKERIELLMNRALKLQRDGLIKISKGSIAPTLKGFILNNIISRELMF
ncbi:MAG: radical SAM family heme chaperone HemW [Deltaproteobacteria bacterium]|nr:radical SAM family heme chaperone HemW [Deltaproteobacteria bacterium]